MTLDELRKHIAAVVDYSWEREFADAQENGLEGHIMENLIALAGFIGSPISDDELAKLRDWEFARRWEDAAPPSESVNVETPEQVARRDLVVTYGAGYNRRYVLRDRRLNEVVFQADSKSEVIAESQRRKGFHVDGDERAYANQLSEYEAAQGEKRDMLVWRQDAKP